jgi:hypothetical protein
MNTHFKLTTRLEERLRSDLTRSHAYAAERVGFITVRFGWSNNELLILSHGYRPVADDHYEVDLTVGARISGAAIRGALQAALNDNVGIFHVHLHDHRGHPRPSTVDWAEWARFVPNFWHVCPKLAHGALLLSSDRVAGWYWYPGCARPERLSRFSIVGGHLRSFKEGA